MVESHGIAYGIYIIKCLQTHATQGLIQTAENRSHEFTNEFTKFTNFDWLIQN